MSLAAKRWLLCFQRMAPVRPGNGGYALTTLECVIVSHLFEATWRDPRSGIDPTPENLLRTLDYWMTQIIVYVIKFYGTSYDSVDRDLIRWARHHYFDSPEDLEWQLGSEIQALEVLSPHAVRLGMDDVWEGIFDENGDRYTH